MRITSSDIRFASQHAEVSRQVRKETIEERIRQPEKETPSQVSSRESTGADRSTMMSQRVLNPNLVGVPDRFAGQGSLVQRMAQSLEGRRQSTVKKAETAPGANGVDGAAAVDLELSAEDKTRIELIMAAVERMSGKKIKLIDPETAVKEAYQTPDVTTLPAVQEMAAQEVTAQAETNVQSQPAPIREVRYHFEESYYEAEATTFDAQGVVKTADGQEIAIDVSLSMSREFAREVKMDVVMEETVKDPLVINFDGTAAELTQHKYEFDIDMDGSADQIHFVGSGSGFLALDHNGDGTVNDGGELFGARTGDGFGELSAYDDDGNGWIDEGDSVYEGLRIWSKDADGNNSLVALGQRGVGAIYLGHVNTPFQMKDENNQLQGIVRSSGVYLSESGSVGTVQKVDLVV